MKKKIAIIAVVFVIAGTLFVQASSASAKEGHARPGWGHGDDNHVHVGPPGRSVIIGHDHDHDGDDKDHKDNKKDDKKDKHEDEKGGKGKH